MAVLSAASDLRSKALRVAFDAAIELIFAKFCADLAEFEIVPITHQSEIVGAILRKGPEVHVSVMPHLKGLWMTKGVLRYLRSVIDEHGYAQTGANTEDGKQFVERLGFVREGDKYILR